MKKILLLTWAMISTLFAFATSATLYGPTVDIRQTPNGDLYVAAGTVFIHAPIHGDLVIVGGRVYINDTVTGNISVIGGNVSLNGYASGNIRCASGLLKINGYVKGNIAAAGGKIIISKEASVNELIALGGNAEISGNILGNLNGSFGEMKLSGVVYGNLECRAEKILIDGHVYGDATLAATRIETGQHYYFGRRLRYWNTNEQLILDPRRVMGDVTLDPGLRFSENRWYYFGTDTVLGLFWYLGTAMSFILVIQLLFGRALHSTAILVTNKSLRSIGYGFLFIVGIPLIAIAFICTLIGLPIGLLILLLYGILLILSALIAAVLSANIYAIHFNRPWGNGKIFLAASVIFIVFKLAMAVPVLGWLFALLLCLWSLGGLVLSVRRYYSKNR